MKINDWILIERIGYRGTDARTAGGSGRQFLAASGSHGRSVGVRLVHQPLRAGIGEEYGHWWCSSPVPPLGNCLILLIIKIQLQFVSILLFGCNQSNCRNQIDRKIE